MNTGAVSSELDQMLADARARLAATSSQSQPQEYLMTTTTPIPTSAPQTPLVPAIAPPKKKPTLLEAIQAGQNKSAVAAAAAGVAGGNGAGIDQDRPPVPEFNPGPGWFLKIIGWFKALIRRFLGVVSSAAQPAPPAVDQEVDPRDTLLADLRHQLSEARAELARLRAAAAARGWDLSNLTQAEDAASRTSDAASRALEFDQARDRARQRREVSAMMSAHRGAKAAVAEISSAADDVDRAAADQARLDNEEARAAAAALDVSDLDGKDPARAEQLRQAWLILDRKIRAAHAQMVHDLRHPPSSEPEGPLPMDPAARVKLIEEHRAALKQERLDRDDQLASWADERRAIEREMWPDQEVDLDDETQRERQ